MLIAEEASSIQRLEAIELSNFSTISVQNLRSLCNRLKEKFTSW